jgi:hypothetical protein
VVDDVLQDEHQARTGDDLLDGGSDGRCIAASAPRCTA